MNEQDYRIKYLKYKQKYTNALQNMQCGGKNPTEALNPQPKAVYIIPKEANDKLKILLDKKDEKKISKYTGCVDKLVSIAGKVFKLKPMTDYAYLDNGKKWVWNDQFKGRQYGPQGIKYKDGIQMISGEKTEAPTKQGDKGIFENLQFGQNPNTRLYNPTTALKHLQDESSYFISDGGIKEPHIVVFGADNTLHLCGPLILAKD